MSRIHIYFLVVGYANASLLTDTTFVLIDNILVKAQDHNMFHHLFLSGNPRLHGYVWLRKINPIPTVKDYHYFRSINKEIATRKKFYKCNDFYLGIGSIHHSKVFIEHFMLGPLLDARRKKKCWLFSILVQSFIYPHIKPGLSWGFGEVNGILLWTLLALAKSSKMMACHRILSSPVSSSTRPGPQWTWKNIMVCILNFPLHLF